MLTENQLEMLGDQIAALYQALEQDVIADIARRVKKTKRFTETAELMAQAMKETGKSPNQIRAEVMKLIRADKAFQDEVAKNTKEWKEFVREEIKATEAASKEAGNDIIANAGDMSFNYDMEAWQQAGMELTKDSAFTRMVEEMSKATAGTLKNLTRSTGFKGVHGTTALKNAYRQYLDKALIKRTTGTFSYDQCVNDCVKELAQSGLRSVDYASGRTYQLDTAARMAIRTANSQLAGQISMHYIEKTDTDLVEVSAHWGARPEHAVWQGKIYSRSGKNKKYPNFSVCHYGDIDGLKGINCRHDFYPFFEGISEPTTWPDEPKPKEYRGKMYDYYHATQKQRKMERDIRATKREIEAQKAIGGDTSLLEAQKRKQIKEYHNFSNAMGIRAKDNRLRVIKGTSDLKTAKKSVEKPKSNDIINAGAIKGALTDKNDPLYIQRDKHAFMYYEAVRNSKKADIVKKIAKNSGMSEKSVAKVYEHVFINEYELYGGKRRFDPDYDMAESFRRLREGKNVQEHDMIMLKHERLEYELMKKNNMNYLEAHRLAEKKYNYQEALLKFKEENNL